MDAQTDIVARVGWIAGRTTVEYYAPVLAPLIEPLHRRGVAVSVFHPSGADISAMEACPLELRRYDRPGVWHPRKRVVESLAAQASDIDLLHGLHESAFPQTVRLAHRLMRPYLLSCYDQRTGLPRRGRDPLLGGVLATSEPIRRQLAGRLRSVEKLHLLRPAVHAVSESADLSYTERNISVLADAHQANRNDLQAMIKAFARLHEKDVDCLFFVIGSGRHERVLRKLAETVGLTGRLTFVDLAGAAHALSILRSCDVYLALDTANDLDLHPLLAMAWGVAVVAAKGGPEDYLLEGKTATLFTPGSARDLSDKLIEAVTSGEQSDWQSDNALDYIAGHHHPDTQAAQLAELYGRIRASRS
jgi:glycosyltransferase involved in cell wall biosynthesis